MYVWYPYIMYTLFFIMSEINSSLYIPQLNIKLPERKQH